MLSSFFANYNSPHGGTFSAREWLQCFYSLSVTLEVMFASLRNSGGGKKIVDFGNLNETSFLTETSSVIYSEVQNDC